LPIAFGLIIVVAFVRLATEALTSEEVVSCFVLKQRKAHAETKDKR